MTSDAEPNLRYVEHLIRYVRPLAPPQATIFDIFDRFPYLVSCAGSTAATATPPVGPRHEKKPADRREGGMTRD